MMMKEKHELTILVVIVQKVDARFDKLFHA